MINNDLIAKVYVRESEKTSLMPLVIIYGPPSLKTDTIPCCGKNKLRETPSSAAGPEESCHQ